MNRRAIFTLAGTMLLLAFCALLLHVLLYAPLIGSVRRTVLDFPRSVGFIAGTVGRSTSDWAQRYVGASIPYRRPLGTALESLGRSVLFVGLALVWVALLAGLRLLVAAWERGSRDGRLLPKAARLVATALEPAQRLPGLIVYLLLAGALELGHHPLPASTAGRLLLLSLVLANSDGLIPDLSAVLVHRRRELEERDYIKVGLLEGRRRLALMGRELLMCVADLLGSRALQILGSAFILELIFRYPGLGYTCVTELYGTSGSSGEMGTASAIAATHLVFSSVLLLICVSATVITLRRIVLRFLDPRPRAGEAL